MSPDQFKFSIDVIVLLVGFISIIFGFKSAVGGTFGTAMKYILIGMSILTLNHFLDTVYLADGLKAAGHTKDFLQPVIVHRLINLVGFLFIGFGYLTLTKSQS